MESEASLEGLMTVLERIVSIIVFLTFPTDRNTMYYNGDLYLASSWNAGEDRELVPRLLILAQ